MTTSDTVAANRTLVLKAITGRFVDRNPAVVDELFSPDYRQHNPQIPNGIEAIKGLLGQLPENFAYQPGLVMADGDYVAVHGRYVGWGPSLWWRSISSASRTAKSSNIGT